MCLGRPAGGPAPGRGSATLADVDPLAVVPTVSFDDVGGLDHHIQALKEMVMLPLLYPEVSATPMRMYVVSQRSWLIWDDGGARPGLADRSMPGLT